MQGHVKHVGQGIEQFEQHTSSSLLYLLICMKGGSRPVPVYAKKDMIRTKRIRFYIVGAAVSITIAGQQLSGQCCAKECVYRLESTGAKGNSEGRWLGALSEAAKQRWRRLCLLRRKSREAVAFAGKIVYTNKAYDAACFGAYGRAGPVRRCAVNHVRRGTEQH